MRRLSGLLAGLSDDVTFAIRVLGRNLSHTVLTVATMALGIGATTAVVALASSVLLKPLPWPDSGRLIRLAESRQGRARLPWTISNATYLAFSDQPRTVEAVGGWRTTTMTLAGWGDADRIVVTPLTPSMFGILGVRPTLGRSFRTGDGAPGSQGVVLLSHGLWMERMGGQASVVGRMVRLDSRAYTVVGVMPRGFSFPDADTRAWIPFWVPPLTAEDGSLQMALFPAMARLRPGVTIEQAAREATARGRNAPDGGQAAFALFGSKGGIDIAAASALDVMIADVRQGLVLMFVTVALLMLGACGAVAALLLARAVGRCGDVAIRAVLGATPARLVRQTVVESVAISIGAGILGLAMAAGLVHMFRYVLPADFPRLENIGVDARVSLFAAALTVATGMLCGAAPAFLVRGTLSRHALPGGAGLGENSRAGRIRTLILVLQTSLAFVLLVVTGLLAQSYVSQLRVDRGYRTRGVLAAAVSFGPEVSGPRRTQILERLAARLRAVPGVDVAAYGNSLPLVSSGRSRTFVLPPASADGAPVTVQAIERIVAPDYFAALGIRLVAGRLLSAADAPATRRVAVVTRSFAAKYLAGRPIGSRLPLNFLEKGAQWEVVGIVEDLRQGSLETAVLPEFFVSSGQVPAGVGTLPPALILRASSDPRGLIPVVRRLTKEEDASAVLDSVASMDERLRRTLARPRAIATFVSGFAVFVLALSTVGIFAALSYAATRRQREIGVRAALGARPRDAAVMLFGHTLKVVVAGCAIGFVAARLTGGLIASLLYGVSPGDAVCFAGAAAVVATTSLLATVPAAVRAARVDPAVALREW